jgi:hypothetical protein
MGTAPSSDTLPVYSPTIVDHPSIYGAKIYEGTDVVFFQSENDRIASRNYYAQQLADLLTKKNGCSCFLPDEIYTQNSIDLLASWGITKDNAPGLYNEVLNLHPRCYFTPCASQDPTYRFGCTDAKLICVQNAIIENSGNLTTSQLVEQSLQCGIDTTPTPSEPTPSEPTPSEPTPTPSEPTPTPSEPTPTPSEPTPSEPTPVEPTPTPTPIEPVSNNDVRNKQLALLLLFLCCLCCLLILLGIVIS